MKRNEVLFLSEILEQIGLIQKTTNGITREKFEKDINLRDATIRRLEIIGEAAKNISDETKQKYPEIEWKAISGTRDVLIHAYFGVDMGIVWKIIKRDVPVLKDQIERIKKDLEL